MPPGIVGQDYNYSVSGVFLTFSGNCRKALSLYQSCFGGNLKFELFTKQLKGFSEKPVVRGSLFSKRIVIHASDLVHTEGRKLGNNISVFLLCKNNTERKELIVKMVPDIKAFASNEEYQELIEIIDAFDVRWVLSV